MRARAASRNGFTLMEMMMVIVIIGIMTGMMIPSFRNVLDGQALKNTAQGVANLVRYARSESIQQSAETKLVFDSETGQVVFSIESDPFNQAGVFTEQRTPFPPPEELIRGKVKIASILKSNLFGGLEENELDFRPNGSSSDALIQIVEADKENPRVYTVGVVGLTGQTLIWDHAVENLYAE
ncbi:MAG: prepilin-type N-terminal cleavage/methylation domain-containing protein [bacterium]|nr:prepilin-type N-terminal cleavage/methylation domain-containing protein [bacterium]